MTVEPGEGGQKLIEETIQKISELKKYISQNMLDVEIEADGGINTDNVDELKDSGVDIIVSGSAIIGSNNYTETVNKLKK